MFKLFIYLLTLSGAFCVGAAAQLPNPVVRYTFDDPFGFVEPNAIGADYPALVERDNLQQSAPKREAGHFGNAVRAGSRAAATSRFPADETFTLSYWMLMEAPRADKLYRCHSETENLIEMWTSRTEPVVYARVGGITLAGGGFSFNEWTCIVLTHDGQNASLYIDGIHQETKTAPMTANPFNQRVAFANIEGVHGNFQGMFDELRVYDEALTAAEVDSISDASHALANLPPIADAGPDHTLYLNENPANAIPLEGRTTGLPATSSLWSVLEKPAAASVSISAPNDAITSASFNSPGDYLLRFRASNTFGPSEDTIRVVVFPPHPSRAPATLHPNPYLPGTHNPGSGFRDHITHPTDLYDQAFVDEHFPAIPMKMKPQGFAAERFRPPPPAYQHPRIFFNHDDLADMRRRLRYTKAGQSALSEARTWHEMSTSADGVPAPYWNKTIAEDGSASYGSDNGAAMQWCSGAYLALIDADTELARRLIDAAVAIIPNQLEYIDTLTPLQREDWQEYTHWTLGRYATAYIYDFLYPWMTEAERTAFRNLISLATRETDSIGMFAVPGGYGDGNWVCWVTGDLLINITAIEGEDGFDPVVYAEAEKAMINFYKNGIAPDGSNLDGLGKNAFAAENLLLLAKRGQLSIATENVYNHIAKFYLHTMHPSGEHTITTDLWGGSRSSDRNGRKADPAILKFAYPDDPVIDFVYRNAVKGETYATESFRTTYGYCSGLIHCWIGEDWEGNPDVDTHAREALVAEPLAQHFNYYNVSSARSGWDKNATMLYFHPRMIGGHVSPDRGTFVFAGLGRDWSYYQTGHNNISTRQHSIVTIDERDANYGRHARVTAFEDTPQSTLMACDLKPFHANRPLPTWNAYRLTPTPEPWFDLPNWQRPHWNIGDRPYYATAQSDLKESPMIAGARITTLVRGDQPYAIITDDINLDGHRHTYRWQMNLVPELDSHVVFQGLDAIVTDPETGHRLLVRPLNPPAGLQGFYDNTGGAYDAFIVYESNSVHCDLKVLLAAIPADSPVPASGDLSAFTNLDQHVAQIDAQAALQKQEALDEIQNELLQVKATSEGTLSGKQSLVPTENHNVVFQPGQFGNAYYFDGEAGTYLQFGAEAPPVASGQAFTLGFWAKLDGSSDGLLYNRNGNKGLQLKLHSWPLLRLSADNNWYWHRERTTANEGWAHIVVSYDGSVLSSFENGQLLASRAISSLTPGAAARMGENYKGWIEDICLFDRELTPGEVASWYGQAEIRRLENLVRWGGDNTGLEAPIIQALPAVRSGSGATFQADLRQAGQAAATIQLVYGDNDAGSDANAWDHVVSVGSQPAFTVDAALSQVVANLPAAPVFFRFRATNSFGSRWSETGMLSAPNAALGTFNLITPHNGILHVPASASFDWSDADGANGYDVYLWPQGESRPVQPSASTVTSAFTPIANLPEETAYQWQVVARNDGSTRESPVFAFRTTPAAYPITIDPNATVYRYDFGEVGSPTPAGWHVLPPNASGDITWSGSELSTADWGGSPSINDLNRDVVTGAGFDISQLSHKLAPGTWRVELVMGEQGHNHWGMKVWAEDQLVSQNITTANGEFKYVEPGGAEVTPTFFDVRVADGELNLSFFANASRHWAASQLTLTKIPGAPFDVHLNRPLAGQDRLERRPLFDWQDTEEATSYQLYLWQQGNRPATPTATIAASADSTWRPNTDLSSGATYNWQLVAANPSGTSESPVWTFTTEGAAEPTLVDLSATRYRYDFGPPLSAVPAGWTRITPQATGDIYWGGAPVSASVQSGDALNRDGIFGSAANAISSFNHRIANGRWRVELVLGDAGRALTGMQVIAENRLVGTPVNTAAAGFKTVNGSAFYVNVNDGELNLALSTTAATDTTWAATRLRLTKVRYDADKDGWPDEVEQQFGANAQDSRHFPRTGIWRPNANRETLAVPIYDGLRFKIQSSLNLVDWIDEPGYTTFQEGDGTGYIDMDLETENDRRRYYRIQYLTEE